MLDITSTRRNGHITMCRRWLLLSVQRWSLHVVSSSNNSNAQLFDEWRSNCHFLDAIKTKTDTGYTEYMYEWCTICSPIYCNEVYEAQHNGKIKRPYRMHLALICEIWRHTKKVKFNTQRLITSSNASITPAGMYTASQTACHRRQTHTWHASSLLTMQNFWFLSLCTI